MGQEDSRPPWESDERGRAMSAPRIEGFMGGNYTRPMIGNVLIVDDSLVARLSLKGILKETGLALAEASSGEAALELLASGLVPKLMFLDLTMPGMGGVETLRAIKEKALGFPVIVVTADIQSRTLDSVRELGAYAIVRKPADRGEILGIVERVLAGGGSA